jgi:uncharacterized protein (DUF1697 family)
MTRYVALLRGINVNGRTIPMAELRSAIEELDVADVSTVLATGNVVLTAAGSKTAVKKAIEATLTDTFGYDAHVVLLTAAEVKSIVADCPISGTANTHAYVVASSDMAKLRHLVRAAGDLDESVETVELGRRAAYWRVRKGSSTRTPFAKAAAKRTYVAAVTTRNLNTMEKILAAL